MRPDLIIIDDEPALLDTLCEGVRESRPNLVVESASSVEAAERLIAESGAPRLLISDFRLPGRSGLDFILEAHQQYPEMRFILMSAFDFPLVDDGKAQRLVRFLRKPFDLLDLVAEVDRGLEAGFRGEVTGITLVDLLQVLGMGRRTACLRVQHEGAVGSIWVAEGDVVHARAGQLEGRVALSEVLSWTGGAYAVDPDEEAPQRTIHDSLNFLLLENARVEDEARRDAADQIAASGSAPASEVAPPPSAPGLRRASSGLDLPRMSLPSGGKKGRTTPVPVSTIPQGDQVSSIDEACRLLVEQSAEAVAANVVDLRTGMMLGGHFESDFTTEHFEAVSAAATNLFRGKETLRVEKLVQQQRGDTSKDHFIQDVQFSTPGMLHFLMKLPDKEAVLALVVVKPGTIGMGWASIRGAAPRIAGLVPD